MPDFPEIPQAAVEPIHHLYLQAPAIWLVHEEATKQAKCVEGKGVPPAWHSLRERRLSLRDQPCLPGHMPVAMHSPFTDMASLQGVEVPLQLPTVGPVGKDPWAFVSQQVPSSTGYPCCCFPCRVPVTKEGHTSLLVALSPQGSRMTHDCRCGN